MRELIISNRVRAFLQQQPLRGSWWSSRYFVGIIVVAVLVPLIWPTIPPLTDLPGHMGRYQVSVAEGKYRWLKDWYQIQPALSGNLGADILVRPLAKLVPLESAVKAIVMASAALFAMGLLWLAREVHGRVPATTLFAVPLIYGFPFQFGFLNYILSIALALNLFALWLRLGKLGRTRLRAVIFIPLTVLLWTCHVYGWVVLGMLTFSNELVHEREKGKPWIQNIWSGGIRCLPLAVPLVLMLIWRGNPEAAGRTEGWFLLRDKAKWILMVLRDRWIIFDIISAGILYVLIASVVAGTRSLRERSDPALSLAFVLLSICYFIMPATVFGSHYADMRLVPVALAIGILALRPLPYGEQSVAWIGITFLVARLLATTISFGLYNRSYDDALAALTKVPVGARVVSFIGRPCHERWAKSRLEHLPSMLIVRRLAFSNDQWALGGAQPMKVRYTEAGRFGQEPSQMVYSSNCYKRSDGSMARAPGGSGLPITEALSTFPRHAFDFVWLIQPPPYPPASLRGLKEIWRNGNDVLFKIVRTPTTPTQWQNRLEHAGVSEDGRGRSGKP
jgi:hypothetical protein